ncbi:hypothetical protein L1987_78196 [Smallanthus sonchifolius]|uniref:Uncharacterized protein n=1 Tax=Smallanthus sonchifolius TaxID=185202 RepID=A0ACB8ZD27_9ASTR|nr:hypothetical protein L1987_78196 [Smallanthus sonchifolius]
MLRWLSCNIMLTEMLAVISSNKDSAITLAFSLTNDAVHMGTWSKVGDLAKKVGKAGKKCGDVENRPFDGKRKSSGFPKNRSGFKKKRNQNFGKAYAANASGSSGGKTICERCG